MRYVIVNRQFQHLGVDHDHPAFFRGQAVEEGHEHRVDRNRLTRACRSGHQQVRHLGQIGQNWLTTYIFS